ncbi:MAG: VWA domain-containing protein [Myxococcales bacterium]|nr:VWA domain-containing protein [Myxococcales bacterium]
MVSADGGSAESARAFLFRTGEGPNPAPTVTCAGGVSCSVTVQGAVAGSPRGTLLILVDSSGSNEDPEADCTGCPTDPKRKRVEAVKRLVNRLLYEAPGWRIGVADFGSFMPTNDFVVARMLGGFSSRAPDLASSADNLISLVGTPLFDGLWDVLPVTKADYVTAFGDAGVAATAVRVLVLSDGEDTLSQRKLPEVVAWASDAGVAIDCIGYGSAGDGGVPVLSTKAWHDLRALAFGTGGLVGVVTSDELPDLLDAVGFTHVRGFDIVDFSLSPAQPVGAALSGDVGGNPFTFEVQ